MFARGRARVVGGSGSIGGNGVARRIPNYAHVLRPAKRGVGRELPSLAGDQLHMRHAAAQFLERHPHLHAREAVAEAVMTAPAERQMLIGVVAANVEGVAVGEMIGVAITRAERE